jgi:hypothetical protein
MRGVEPDNDWGMNYEDPTGAGTADDGDAVWAVIAGTGSEWAANVIENGEAAEYENCVGCFTPDLATFEAQFVDFDGDNFRIATGSAYENAGTDGEDIGADIDAIEVFTTIALSGNDVAAPARVLRPRIRRF